MEFLLAGFGALLAIIGALAQSFIARNHALADRRRELLIEAYSAFLSGVAQRVAILERHSPRTEEATALLIAGKQKITAYAPSAVVRALAAFCLTSQNFSDDKTKNAMVELVTAMRKSVGVDADGLEAAVSDVLFGGTTFVSDNN